MRVRGVPVVRLFGPAARRRLDDAARRLAPLLSPSSRVVVGNRGAGVVANGVLLLTAEQSDAARAGTGRIALAREWARALAEALATPAIAVTPASVVLSPGATATATIAVTIPGEVRLGSYDRRVADVVLEAGTLRIAARQLGSTVVPLRVGAYRSQLGIAVRPAAGVIPAAIETVVTGAPADPDLIREAILRRLQEAVLRSPGAVMEMGPIEIAAPLEPGASLSTAVAVLVRSPYAGSVRGRMNVTVANQPLPLADPAVLLISNRPEKITGDGLLFQETLVRDRPARLLYHHMNGTPSQVRVLKVTLANPGAAAARVHYVRGIAGPSPDFIHAGFASTARFLGALASGQGYFVEVPPRGATAFTAYTLAPLAMVSGLMQFQVTEGGPVELVVHVRLPWLLDRTVTTDLGPWAFQHPRGTFPGSLVEIVREQAADEPAHLADLGVMSGLRDVRTGEPLIGDYGVLYRVRLRLVNPTSREVATELVATAAGGLARGLFIVDGAPVDVGLMRPGEGRPVAAFAVAPGGARDVSLVAMPVAGSYYPVRLALRPR